MLTTKDYSHVTNAHPEYIDTIYQKYLDDPASVEDGWRVFFDGFEYGAGAPTTESRVDLDIGGGFDKEMAVNSVIHGYRTRGHLLSTTNPIRDRLDRKPRLLLEDYGLSEADLDKTFGAGRELNMGSAKLRDIIQRLEIIYSGNVGFEYCYIENYERRMWLRKAIEERSLRYADDLHIDQKKRILDMLNGAVIFERFLHTKYIGQKRFSLEGGENTIVALDAAIAKAVELGAEEIVLGMAHRGRLNVLANIMGKTYENIFAEFEGNQEPDEAMGAGDVKYHLGFSSEREVHGRQVNLKLMPNPSHLESVAPVVAGYARAKLDSLYDGDRNKIVPIIIHGDAAVAGQGVVYETAQMTQLEANAVGGAIHFVINNQIGFTTDFLDARTSTYSTGVASAVQAPVFHVNGDDPEAVLWVMELAIAYRQKFQCDVYVDMVCYRRHGHNEGDDPKFTQPQMYEQIGSHPDPRAIYIERLVQRGDVEAALAKDLETKFWSDLQKRLDLVRQEDLPYTYQPLELAWQELKRQEGERNPVTGIEEKKAWQYIDHLRTLPAGFEPLGKVNRLIKGINKLADQNQVNWGMGELMAYAAILEEGKDVRLCGQDVERGTFSHRHAILKDKKTYRSYNRLSGISKDQGRFMIYNSLLSEYAALGFEYGYSLADPHRLNIWEAQFGDFYNGAQIMIDQYISSGESKWRRMSGLVMLLPHGYEGQGPEHSSARLERFLQMCAEENMTVTNLTTPANLFHALRRQLATPYRRPLINMSPKSLLRHPACVSDVTDFGPNERFQEVIEPALTDEQKSQIKRLILCTGKIYYDLAAYQMEHNIQDVAIMRIEQLYPLDIDRLDVMMGTYTRAEVCWVQEEPENMGAWFYIAMRMPFVDIKPIARKPSASPATGYKKVHDRNQQALVKQAMTVG